LFHLGDERPRVPDPIVSQQVLGQHQHGQLGEPVAGQHVDGAALDHLPRGGQPVPVEPAAVGDAKGLALLSPPPRFAPAPTHVASSRMASRSPPLTWSPGRARTSVTVPARGAVIRCSIFMASTIIRSWPWATASPGATCTASTVPGIGATRPPATA